MSSLEGKRLGGALLPYLVLVLVHLLSGLPMEQPLVPADEVGYLGNARYLAGAAHLPDMRGTSFYHFGYSLLLVPLFWLFTEPVAVYKAAIFINALLVSGLFFPLRFIIASVVRLSPRAADWIAFACCLYPSLVLYSSLAWSESAFLLVYALAVAQFGRFLATTSTRDLLLMVLAVGSLYTIHPRALPILAAVLVYLALLTGLRVISAGRLLLAGSAMAALFAVTRVVNMHLQATGWGGGGDRYGAVRLARRLAPDADLPALVERAMGQLLYVSLASQGLALLGLVAMVWLVAGALRSGSVRGALATPGTGVPLFVLTTGGGVFLGATTLKLYAVHGELGVRGADFIHGRYNEALAVVALAYGLAEWWRRDLRRSQVIRRVVLVVVLVVVLALVVGAEVEDALSRQVADTPGARPPEAVWPYQVDPVAVPGVYPLVVLTGALNLRLISAIVLGSFLLITLILRLSRRGGGVALMLVFAFLSYLNHRHYLQERTAKVRPRLDLAAQFGRLGRVPEVSYDAALREPGIVPAMQFLLPDAVFARFDSRRGQLPATEALFAGSDWPHAAALGAKFVRSSGRGTALWLLPGELRSALPVTNYEGVTLGATRRLDLWESGFYAEESFAVGPGRWTNGAATLRVPVNRREPPRTLEVETLVPGRDRTRLQVLANGVELWHGEIPGGPWSRRFGLEPVPLGEELLIELNSDTSSPPRRRGRARARRTLGVVVTGIRLGGEAPAEPCEDRGRHHRDGSAEARDTIGAGGQVDRQTPAAGPSHPLRLPQVPDGLLRAGHEGRLQPVPAVDRRLPALRQPPGGVLPRLLSGPGLVDQQPGAGSRASGPVPPLALHP